VQAASSVTELPAELATHPWVPSELMDTGSWKPKAAEDSTQTGAPVEALISLTEYLAGFATHTWFLSEETASGLAKA
jgi:hypothetical protein